MKRWLSALLLVILLAQALPFDALATVGKVLSEDELARAYALTGLGTGGLAANANGKYHSGMKPNASWNASQLDDWLEEKLSTDLKTVNEILSQATYTLEKMKADQPKRFSKYADDKTLERAQALYLEAEKLRETLRYYQDQLKEASGVIAEMSRWMGEDGASMFDSDRVRYSARIEEAEQEIVDIRQIIADNADEWVAQIDRLQKYLQFGSEGNEDDELWIGEWMSALLSDSGEPVSNTATVNRVAPTASRMSRLSAAARVAPNAVDDVKITVINESEVALVLQTGTKEKPVPVKGVSVKASDALKPDSVAETYTTNKKGVVVFPINKFTLDEFDVVHLRLEVDPTAQGYQDYIVEDLDLEKGEVYANTLTPIGEASADGTTSNAQGDPYVYMMSFDKKDIMHSQYDMIYSPVNNYEFEIRVGVKNTEGKGLPDLLMRYYTNDGGTSVKESWASPTGREGDVYVFKGAWKSKFAPPGRPEQGSVAHLHVRQGRRGEPDVPFHAQIQSERHRGAHQRGHRSQRRRIRQRAGQRPGREFQNSNGGYQRQLQHPLPAVPSPLVRRSGRICHHLPGQRGHGGFRQEIQAQLAEQGRPKVPAGPEMGGAEGRVRQLQGPVQPGQGLLQNQGLEIPRHVLHRRGYLRGAHRTLGVGRQGPGCHRLQKCQPPGRRRRHAQLQLQLDHQLSRGAGAGIRVLHAGRVRGLRAGGRGQLLHLRL